MNEVATRGTGFGLINRADLAKNLGNAAMAVPVAGNSAFLKVHA